MRHAKRYFAVLLAALLLMAMPIFAFALEPAKAKNMALDYIAQNVTLPAFGDEWFVLIQARSGVKKAQYYKDFYGRVETYLRNRPGAKLSNPRSTENSRLILALSAIGRDATAVGGYDLTEPFSDMDWVTKQGLNGPVYALLAMDSGGYGTKALRDTLLEYILEYEIAGGGWSFTGFAADADMTAMALQALAAHRDVAAAAAAIDRAVPVLSNIQNANGSFGYEDERPNTESTSQVIIALTALGIDPMTDARFVKAGGNPISAILAYQLTNGGFKHKLTDTKADGIATEQAARALVAYGRFVNGESSLYANMYEPHPHAFGEWFTRAAASCTETGIDYRSCDRCVMEEETRSVAPLGHSDAVTIIQPTKKAGGYTLHICTRCGDSYNDSYTAKLKRTAGFVFLDWILFIIFFGWIWME